VSAFEMGDGSGAPPPSRLAPAYPLESLRRGTCPLLRLTIPVNFWIDHPPDVHTARPAVTPGCGRAAAPPGGPLLLHGHGTRERVVRGVLAHDRSPAFHEVLLRRYRSTCCGVTCTVAPADVLPYKRFGAVSIALVLAYYGVLREALARVRERLNPIPQRGFDDEGWRAARRWIATVTALFADVRPAPDDWTLRQVAERAAMTIVSRIPGAVVTDGTLPALLVTAACRSP